MKPAFVIQIQFEKTKQNYNLGLKTMKIRCWHFGTKRQLFRKVECCCLVQQIDIMVPSCL